MKKHIISLLAISLIFFNNSWTLKKRKKEEPTIEFSFENKLLIDIINEISAKLDYSVILPQNPAEYDALKKQKINYLPKNNFMLTPSESWRQLSTFVQMSGFSISPVKDKTYIISRTGKDNKDMNSISRQILPIYIDVPYDLLPKSSEYIRYILHLNNIKVPNATEEKQDPAFMIIKDMKSTNAPDPICDEKTNSIILCDKSNTISSIIHLITEIDNSGFREVIEIIQIRNLAAETVENIFKNLKSAAGTAPAKGKAEDSVGIDLSEFSVDTKIIADKLSNRLILMGRDSSVRFIRDFIEEQLDVPLESGKSVIHIYDLQYLDSEKFAPILEKILGIGKDQKPSKDSKEDTSKRGFSGVTVAYESRTAFEDSKKDKEAKKEKDKLVQDVTKKVDDDVKKLFKGGLETLGLPDGQVSVGGNRIIVFCTDAQWQQISSIISSLDTPKKQIIIEVLIVNFIGTKESLISSDSRNKNGLPLPSAVDYLSSQITGTVMTATSGSTSSRNPATSYLIGGTGTSGNNPQTLAADLLKAVNPQITDLMPTGSLIISFKDPTKSGAWALLNILQQYIDTKIVDQPFLLCTDNQKGTISSSVVRRNRGDAIPGPGGTTKVDIENIAATIQVQAIPRLSGDDKVNLQIAVDINQFLGPNTFDRIYRRVSTNANLRSGDTLVMGGLSRLDTTDLVTQTPFFGNIPIIGWLFKSTQKTIVKTNLSILVNVNQTSPKPNKVSSLYTQNKVQSAEYNLDDARLFCSQQDPIVRFMFSDDYNGEYIIENFMLNSEKTDLEN